MRTLTLAAVVLMRLSSADAFDLQGHRGARGLAPENTREGVATALRIGVTALESMSVSKDGVVVVNDRRPNPDHTRGPDGTLRPQVSGSGRSRSCSSQYDVGRPGPGTAYAAVPCSNGRGARIPALTLADRMHASRPLQYRNQAHLTWAGNPGTGSTATRSLRLLAAPGCGAGHGAILRLAYPRCPLRIAPDIERACLTLETPQASRPAVALTIAVDRRSGHRRFWRSTSRLVAAAGCRSCSPYYGDAPRSSWTMPSAPASAIPLTVNERADMERLIDLELTARSATIRTGCGPCWPTMAFRFHRWSMHYDGVRRIVTPLICPTSRCADSCKNRRHDKVSLRYRPQPSGGAFPAADPAHIP
jgi:glycerophosphoryl diester phosphodiesterase